MMNISFPKECENLTKSQKKNFQEPWRCAGRTVSVMRQTDMGCAGPWALKIFLTSKKIL